MPDVAATIEAAVVAARDWATLLFALLAATYGWKIDRDRRRDRAVLIDGFARQVGEKTLRIDLDVRNRTRSAIRIERLEVRRPAPAVLAMEGVHEPGPGPIACRFVVPAESRGALSFLLGSPRLDAGIAVRCRYRPQRRALALSRRLTVAIDPEEVPAVAAAPSGAVGELREASVDESVGGHQHGR